MNNYVRQPKRVGLYNNVLNREQYREIKDNMPMPTLKDPPVKDKEKIYIEHAGKKWQLVGVKAMLRPVDGKLNPTGGKLKWFDVKLDVLTLMAAMKK